MQHRPPRSARAALTAIKVTALASIAVIGVATQSSEAGTGEGTTGYAGYSGYAADEQPSRASRLLERHDCSATGFADATPLSAVVRTARGQLRHVSFEAGWEVYTGPGPATLVAVCLDEAPAR